MPSSIAPDGAGDDAGDGGVFMGSVVAGGPTTIGPIPISYVPDNLAAVTVMQGNSNYGPYPATFTNVAGVYSLTVVTTDTLLADTISIQPGDWPLPQTDPSTFQPIGGPITGRLADNSTTDTTPVETRQRALNTPGLIAPGTGRLDRRLATLLGDPITSPFMDGKKYKGHARAAALWAAIILYSDYRPCLRRIGTANLFNGAWAGDNTFLCVGGTFGYGDTIIIDSSGVNPETGIVDSITTDQVEIAGMPDDVFVAPALITLQAPLVSDHHAGSMIIRPVPGLAFAPGQDTYTLPDDFVAPDRASFDMATGAKMSFSRGYGYYDATIADTNRLSGIGLSGSINFGTGYAYTGYPINGDPANNPNGGGSAAQNLGSFCYRFYESAPPRLRLIPAPQAAFMLDFEYNGCHTGESIPQRDQAALLEYALYAAKMTRSVQINETLDTRIGDNIDNVSRNAKVLQAAAMVHLAEFQKRIVNVPFVISG